MKWIEAIDVTEKIGFKGKTRVFRITPKGNNFPLAEVRWYPGWRKYTVQTGTSIFEEDCLRDMADFIEGKTREHKGRVSSSKRG